MHFDFDTVGVVEDPAIQAMFLRIAIDCRAKADALDNATDE